MDRAFLAATTLTVLSIVGYVAGVATPYPGREASLAGLMIGITLAAVTYGRNGRAASGDPETADGENRPHPSTESTVHVGTWTNPNTETKDGSRQ